MCAGGGVGTIKKISGGKIVIHEFHAGFTGL